MADLHVLTRDMRRLSLAVRGYPLGTAEGETTHLLLVMEEVPVCATVPQPGGPCCAILPALKLAVCWIEVVGEFCYKKT